MVNILSSAWVVGVFMLFYMNSQNEASIHRIMSMTINGSAE